MQLILDQMATMSAELLYHARGVDPAVWLLVALGFAGIWALLVRPPG